MGITELLPLHRVSVPVYLLEHIFRRKTSGELVRLGILAPNDPHLHAQRCCGSADPHGEARSATRGGCNHGELHEARIRGRMRDPQLGVFVVIPPRPKDAPYERLPVAIVPREPARRKGRFVPPSMTCSGFVPRDWLQDALRVANPASGENAGQRRVGQVCAITPAVV
jgi:hypothetical protein